MGKKKICFDLDGVICTNTFGDYDKAEPIPEAIKKINQLYNNGYYIIIFTSRFMQLFNGDIEKINSTGYKFTKEQLDMWGLKYHKLLLCKPEYDIFIDDKAYNYSSSWSENIDKIIE